MYTQPLFFEGFIRRVRTISFDHTRHEGTKNTYSRARPKGKKRIYVGSIVCFEEFLFRLPADATRITTAPTTNQNTAPDSLSNHERGRCTSLVSVLTTVYGMLSRTTMRTVSRNSLYLYSVDSSVIYTVSCERSSHLSLYMCMESYCCWAIYTVSMCFSCTVMARLCVLHDIMPIRAMTGTITKSMSLCDMLFIDFLLFTLAFMITLNH